MPKSNFFDVTPLATGARGDLKGWIMTPTPKLTQPLRGAITIVHGLGEHCGRYLELATRFAELGIASLAFDQQGHGESPGRRGVPRSYDSMLQDIDAARVTLGEHFGDVPQWLFGHSMGGNLVTNYTLRWNHDLRGVILSAPMLLPAKPPKREQILAAWLTGKLLPFVRFTSPVKPAQLTHDLAEIERASKDPLMHSRISLRLGTQLLAQGRYALDHAARISIPILVLHGETDSTTDASASHAFCLRIGDRATYRTYPGMHHDILHEVDREHVFRTMTSWLFDQMDLQVNIDGKE